jgi:(R,R)-butanediol dehydrogenase / meso-butanediol dehydrogenase / diacetyl reductase
MRAIRLHGRRDIRLDDVPYVEPHPRTGVQLPVILGHELSADVEAVGSAVDTVRSRDRVAVMPAVYCGECGSCRRGLRQMCARIAGALGP